MTNYYKDRNTGHPAAAYDLLRQNQWALNSGCATGAPIMGSAIRHCRWADSSADSVATVGRRTTVEITRSRYGRPAYNTGYAQQGYGQPYGGGSMLAPLLGQFGIR